MLSALCYLHYASDSALHYAGDSYCIMLATLVLKLSALCWRICTALCWRICYLHWMKKRTIIGCIMLWIVSDSCNKIALHYAGDC
jgi:hypothetical protein